ncbi:MAG TPA: NTP transferase domain-containing protein [Patescibacteria group bacterium]|nr:NTP transferase domain-containing protein [Patescibacteria group bacterium]
MSQATFGAIILAAGFSARMGEFKPLLPMGESTALQMVVQCFCQAGIADVRIVTGHKADELVPVLATLPVTAVHNPDYAEGMFSSVQTGIRSLPESIKACFVLPVDTPLVKSASIEKLVQAFAEQDVAVVYPLFDGRRGHPPLIGRECFADIMSSDGTGGLRAVLNRFSARAREVALDDPGALMDMDTPEDYQRLLQYQQTGVVTASGGVALGETESVCPCCLQRLPARRMAYGQDVYLEKICPEHGEFETLIWQGPPDFREWTRKRTPALPLRRRTESQQGCPFDCGLCPRHRQQSCCVLLEVTARCNLHCPVCFAATVAAPENDPDRETVRGWYRRLLECGGPFNIQLSGGEPTLRDDLPDLIRDGKEMGFSFIQVNTNGLRLAAEPEYVRCLKEAGLDCVFLQFDGVTDCVYQSLRGRALLAEKLSAIEVCGTHQLGVVLVPTLVPGINESQIGSILRLALDHMPLVRGVHFQPISYFGRYPQTAAARLTLPRVLREIERQMDGEMRVGDFRPAGAEHARCSFHGQFTRKADGALQAWQGATGDCGCGTPGSARQAQDFVARQWAAPASPLASASAGCCSASNVSRTDSLDAFLQRVKTHTLAVSGMAFQDADNLDLERLQECFIHVVSPDGRLIPFCAYNLTDRQGRSLYRGGGR